MTPKALTESILLQAFQGKLVPHDSNEGTGNDVLLSLNKELQEKQRLGLIKKSKTAAECSENENDFELPENWEIAKLGYICQLLDGEKRTSHNYPYLEARYLRGKTEPTILSEGKYVPANTNVILVDGENSGEVFTLPEEGYMGSTFKVLFIPECLNRKYIIYFLMLHKSTLRNNKKGAAIPHLNKDIFFNLPLPIPPLAEQERIVTKLEEILPLIDRYEAAWNKLEEFNKRFPVDMQKSILQLAIQGKLVEQRPEEGTGEELFQQIQAGKQVLIKNGKIKKEKPLSEIADDEIPFDIPETWKWIRLADVVTLENGDRSSKYPVESDYVPFGIPFFGAKDMDGRYMSFENVRYISETKFNELGNGKLRDRDFICLLRGSVGKIAMFAVDEKHSTGFICAQMVIVRSLLPELVDYLYIVMTSPYYYRFIEENTTGTAVRQLPAKKLGEIIIPLPPLAEQKRIVAKLEEILPLCDRLK